MKYVKTFENYKAKGDLINEIEVHSASLIWELDDEKYYGLIGWSGGQEEDSSWWISHNLEDMTVPYLTTLLGKLKTI